MNLPLAAVLAFCTASGVFAGWFFALGITLSVIFGMFLTRRRFPAGA